MCGKRAYNYGRQRGGGRTVWNRLLSKHQNDCRRRRKKHQKHKQLERDFTMVSIVAYSVKTWIFLRPYRGKLDGYIFSLHKMTFKRHFWAFQLVPDPLEHFQSNKYTNDISIFSMVKVHLACQHFFGKMHIGNARPKMKSDRPKVDRNGKQNDVLKTINYKCFAPD